MLLCARQHVSVHLRRLALDHPGNRTRHPPASKHVGDELDLVPLCRQLLVLVRIARHELTHPRHPGRRCRHHEPAPNQVPHLERMQVAHDGTSLCTTAGISQACQAAEKSAMMLASVSPGEPYASMTIKTPTVVLTSAMPALTAAISMRSVTRRLAADCSRGATFQACSRSAIA